MPQFREFADVGGQSHAEKHKHQSLANISLKTSATSMGGLIQGKQIIA